MAKRKSVYELAEEAELDLDAIYDYTLSQFGANQAAAYLSGLENKFIMLADQPELGRTRHEICADLRSFVQEKHVIFYRILPDVLRIVRVMHGNADIPAYLKADDEADAE